MISTWVSAGGEKGHTELSGAEGKQNVQIDSAHLLSLFVQFRVGTDRYKLGFYQEVGNISQ